MQDEKKPILIIRIKEGFTLTKKQPQIIVFAGPNGSGKSTITQYVKLDCIYINADEIKKNLDCSDEEATKTAYNRRKVLIEQKKDFAFETVLSSDYNLDLFSQLILPLMFLVCSQGCIWAVIACRQIRLNRVMKTASSVFRN